jgi:hypothetical protein
MKRDIILKHLVQDTITLLKNDPHGIYNEDILMEQFNRALCIGTDHLKFTQKIQKTCKPIIQMDLNNKEIDRFDSVRQAARDTGISKSTIIRAAKGEKLRYNTACGFKWKYKTIIDNDNKA